jgi:hypothetical protein
MESRLSKRALVVSRKAQCMFRSDHFSFPLSG